jgi:hydroxymethylpyrimidine pyrophosphatase-like HAD family hydrolase
MAKDARAVMLANLMLFVALAADYDGTLAHDGAMAPGTLDALKRLKAAGKRLLLVTGRDVESLKSACDALLVFDLVVAENGAVLYFPDSREERCIAPRPPAAFIAALRERGVTPLVVGNGIVATWTPNEQTILEVIRELGLDWQLTFNKGAVMCLAPGVNKASGLASVLHELKLSALNTVGVGDAENDQAFLNVCGCAVAVANALEPVKRSADIITRGKNGAGVIELIERWLDDPRDLFAAVHRHEVYVGDEVSCGARVGIEPDRGAVLISGSSGAGKSRLTKLLIERLLESHYQMCVVDPEGDYPELERVTHLGDAKRTAAPAEVVGALDNPQVSVVVSLIGVDIPHRPEYFKTLLGKLHGLYIAHGRPHWLIIDEAHHVCPRTAEPSGLGADLASAILITTNPENLSRTALNAVKIVAAVGPQANEIIATFCKLTGIAPPAAAPSPNDDQILLWKRADDAAMTVAVGRSKQAHQRHKRNYAEGRLGEESSFYFRGPQQQLNLRAYNLAAFLELAQGVDDETWTFHLRRGDYAYWFKYVIKDDELAGEMESIDAGLDAAASRRAVADAIHKRYIVTSTDVT